MARTLLLVGTRKGFFTLESDEARRDWKLRGPYCEGWPIYHAVHDADTGAIYAAAASEWHGSGVWRSTDLGDRRPRPERAVEHQREHRRSRSFGGRGA